VAESEWFALNLDPRPSIADTAAFDYVSWLSEFFVEEVIVDLVKVGEDVDPDLDGK